MFILLDVFIACVLFVSMLALQGVGRRLGARDHPGRTGDDKSGGSAAEGAVYGLLGLLIAFTFSGAASRYDSRQGLIVDEANAIGTAWLRLDILTPEAQAPLRDLFRQYVDARLETYDTPLGNTVAATRAVSLQGQIWTRAVAAAKEMGGVPPYTVLLPALNDMFDISTVRTEARRVHPPVTVFVMLGLLALVASLFAGYAIAQKPRARAQAIGFAAVLSLALFVILDLEFPRLGFIRVDSADSVIREVRQSME